MASDDQLRKKLEADAAALLRLIARIAPQVDLAPGEIARLDQLAAHAARISREIAESAYAIAMRCGCDRVPASRAPCMRRLTPWRGTCSCWGVLVAVRLLRSPGSVTFERHE